jgi:hypothetical protein
MSLGIKQKNAIILKIKQIQAAEWILSFLVCCISMLFNWLSLSIP